MVWAKYYEDNISIYNNRMFMNEVTEKSIIQAIKAPVIKRPVVFTANNAIKDNRFGIMLSFSDNIEFAVARKLQMNGWWFSKVNSCWCNYNNLINRQYAQRLVLKQPARIIFAT